MNIQHHLASLIPCVIAAVTMVGLPANAKTIELSTLDLKEMSCGWHNPHANRTVNGNPITMNGRVFPKGIGTHAPSVWMLDLNGNADSFHAVVGVDDEVSSPVASVVFQVFGDNKLLWQSPVMRYGQKPATIDIPLRGVKKLQLVVTEGEDTENYDHADWAEAIVEMKQGLPTPTKQPVEEAVILTPPAPATPRINGARIYGVRPRHPFIYRIAATGDRPMRFSADNLPKGLSLDEKTGIITGTITDKTEKTYHVTFRAENAKGKAERDFRIVVGDKIALTPPMGWNSWNCFAGSVTQKNIKDATDSLVKSGLINHGWSYINIDDFWQVNPTSKDPSLHGPGRDKDGYIIPNPRFPDIKSLVAYIHGFGLKAGIYSSPGPLTCGRCLGSYTYEEKDAETYAKWGFDYLKYDWCTYTKVATGKGLERLQKPYIVMRDALAKQNRDIVYSLCQYGWGNVSKWGAEVGGQLWRTTGDIRDTWNSISQIGFNSQWNLAEYAHPGGWNDPDMLVVGYVGWSGSQHQTRLTPNEQYTHISLWSLLAAPLLIGCDMTKLDDFTLNLLTNDEVIDINQDPLGKQARRIKKDGNIEIWAKPMEDGSLAVGLFNRGSFAKKITADWKTLGISGNKIVRDVWRQKDLGTFKDSFSSEVPRHGVRLIRIRKAE